MSTLPQEANTYRVALLIGVADVDTVIAWADRQIQAEAIAANPLIEVSLGRVTVHTPGRQIAGNWAFLEGRLQPKKWYDAANHRRADFEVAARRPGSGAVFVGKNC
ncbi:MAG: hypothetical protein NT171_09095 [Planctomycetota bacterium]|nr:hypothetical protein [Planctomycetota bacterium]